MKIFRNIFLFLSLVFLSNNLTYGKEFIDARSPLEPAFESNNIAIAFASDNKYVKYMSVAIRSLLDNMSEKHNYDIVILENSITNKNKKILTDMCRDYKNVSIRFVDMSKIYKNYNKKEFYVSRHITIATYNRLFIPDIFAKYEKVIYLDGDIIIQGDLVDLYSTNLDNYLIAGIKDMPFGAWLPYDSWHNSEGEKYLQSYLKLESLDHYINAGVILYNINECRKLNFLNLCLEKLRWLKKPERHDQDVINAACEGKIKYLDYRYNFFTYYLENAPKVKIYISKDIIDDIKILHFGGHHPWGRSICDSIVKWYNYAKETPFYPDMEKEYKLRLCRYKLTSKVTFGKVRRKYLKKTEKLTEKMKVLGFLDN